MEALYLLTFSDTHSAIRGEQHLAAQAVPAGVMPVPQAVAAGCGIGLRVPGGELDRALRALRLAGIPVRCYEIVGGAAPTYRPADPNNTD